MATLTKEMIMRKAKVYNLASITQLQLFNQMIDNIEILKEMSNLEQITLSRNQIRSLKGFDNLKHLTILSLQDNLISDFTELIHLRNCTNLKKLWLGQNPICSKPGYRLIVIRYLPFLEILDDKAISDDEREGAHNLDNYSLKGNYYNNENNANFRNYNNMNNPYKRDFAKEKNKERNFDYYDNKNYNKANQYGNRNFYFGESEREFEENSYRERYNTPQKVSNIGVMNSISFLLKDMNKDELKFILNEIDKKMSMY